MQKIISVFIFSKSHIFMLYYIIVKLTTNLKAVAAHLPPIAMSGAGRPHLARGFSWYDSSFQLWLSLSEYIVKFEMFAD